MALQKGGLAPNEAIVVENAPMGVQAGAAAGIFTVAVNTGPIDGQVLLDAGANVLFPSMQDFCKAFDFRNRTLVYLWKRKYFILIVH